jgi:pilus assembly protein CpaB
MHVVEELNSMDRSRIIVLAIAAVAAGAVALLARSLLGGGTQTTVAAPAPQVAMTEVLVASNALVPGSQLTPASVHWQEWPRSSVDQSFITHEAAPDIAKAVHGTVVRAPMVPGEPLTTSKIVHGDAAGYMSAMLMPGMRGVSIPISADSGAGGFILPNDRVDVLCTVQVAETHRIEANTILKDVRVLAVDQTYESKDSKSVVGRTATLELSPAQVELIEHAKAAGSLSLALRALGDNETADNNTATPNDNGTKEISILRYGVPHASVVRSKE